MDGLLVMLWPIHPIAFVMGSTNGRMVPEDLSLMTLLLVLIWVLGLGRLMNISLLSRLVVHLATLTTVGLIEWLIYVRLLEHLRRLGTLRPSGRLPLPLLSTATSSIHSCGLL